MASSSSSSFLLSAADVSWGRRECYTVKVNDLAADMDGEYFLIDALSDDFGSNVEYYVWFDDGVAADPAPAGKTAKKGVNKPGGIQQHGKERGTILIRSKVFLK